MATSFDRKPESRKPMADIVFSVTETGDDHEYKAEVEDPSGRVNVMDWQVSSHFAFTPTAHGPGKYKVRVKSKDDDGNEDTWSDWEEVTVKRKWFGGKRDDDSTSWWKVVLLILLLGGLIILGWYYWPWFDSTTPDPDPAPITKEEPKPGPIPQPAPVVRSLCPYTATATKSAFDICVEENVKEYRKPDPMGDGSVDNNPIGRENPDLTRLVRYSCTQYQCK